MLFFHYQHSFFCGVLLMQLIPARGRLLRVAFPCHSSLRMQLIPARGRLHQQVIVLVCAMGMQLIPARGRLRSGSFAIRLNIWMQLIPARGRLQHLCSHQLFDAGCSLSPRGDGYVDNRFDFSDGLDAAYPREGKVTGFSSHLVFHFLSMQLIPARGRLRRYAADDRDLIERCSLSPRGDFLHMFPLANFRHFIDNSHILCYTSW